MAVMKNAALMSSRSEMWGTPPDLFAMLNRAYRFRLDAASNGANALCPCYFTKDEDGLTQDWSRYRRVWLNPPYGRTIGLWMRKAYEESRKGCIVVALVPARVDTKWWHEQVVGKARVTFLKGRLKFINEAGRSRYPAPFPSALVVYEPIVTVLGADGGGVLLERKCFVPGRAGGGAGECGAVWPKLRTID
jgi:site-specific DNA-methyltransferase (adenine-specific)